RPLFVTLSPLLLRVVLDSLHASFAAHPCPVVAGQNPFVCELEFCFCIASLTMPKESKKPLAHSVRPLRKESSTTKRRNRAAIVQQKSLEMLFRC
ncbi:hypothetical protein CC86DRAFT_439360, partial [Ophiobolus disseminans]